MFANRVDSSTMDSHTLTKACCVYTGIADAKFVLFHSVVSIYVTVKISANQIILC